MRKVYDEPNPFAPEVKRRRKKDEEKGPASSSSSQSQQFSSRATSRAIPTEQRIKRNLQAVDAYTRHKMMINNYVAYYRGSTKKLERDITNDRNDYDIIRENHRFLWSDSELTEAEQDWEANLAKRYYDKLFKEYCIIDLSRYEKNIYAMRWRIEREVYSGKGQFECGNKHCQEREALSSWEVNFVYNEHGVRKNALVKVRLCPTCSTKLNFHSQKRLIKKKVKKELKNEETEEKKRNKERKKEKKRRREEESSSSTSSEDEEAEEQKVPDEEKRKIDEEKNREQAVASASEIWSQKTAVIEAEKTVNDEFDEFIDDLLL